MKEKKILKIADFAKKTNKSHKSKKFKKQADVAPNSLFTGSPGPVFAR